MNAVRAGATFGYGVAANDAFRMFHGFVDLPGRDFESFGYQLEVVDKGLHGVSHDFADVFQ